ncbi:MAG TPA: hypothetical protein VK797_26990 [Tepidisphaeraceae bacterium]|jgi:uncharacterized membrane protein (DUF4010 family)|nr:hypothetical protein [Tepidisphaeraceae bacterium]
MRIHWSLNSAPELAGLPKAQKRTRLWKAHWGSIGHWQWWAGFLLFVLIELSGFVVLRHLGHNGIIETLLLAGFAGFVFGQFVLLAARAHLRQIK